MDSFTRYARKIRMILIKAVTFLCFICLIYVPKNSTSSAIAQGQGYFLVTLNSKTLGAMNSVEDAEEALVIARGRISAKEGGLVYMNPSLSVIEEEMAFGERYSVDDMADIMYKELLPTVIDFNKKDAYTVRINDYTVIISSKDDIVKLVEGVKSNYDPENEFQVRLLGNADAASTEFGVEIVKTDIGDIAASKVISFVDNQPVISPDENTVYEDGTLAMTFSETISITPIQVNESQISTVEDALMEITKETEEKTVYTVVAGDTLSKIAKAHNLTMAQVCALNDGLSEDGVIGIGDEIIVTVPTPELSVRVFEEMTYEEEYSDDVQYIDDDTMYQGEYSVVQEGSKGYREVVAIVEYENSAEKDRTFIRKTVLVEAVPRILKRGTQTPPTYRYPLNGGYLTSGFGYRWGTLHAGVDWGVPVGSVVKASSGGTVVRSGWFSGYGICVDIQHPDGKLTRYAHLSKTLVSVGQKVTQGQQIAKSGNTGNSTGPHLHFEIRVNGTPVNPFNYLK